MSLSTIWLPLLGALIVLFGLAVGWRDLLRFRFRRVRAIAGVCFTEAIRRRILWITPVAIIGVIAVSQLTHPTDELDAIRQTTRYCLFAAGLVVIIVSVLLACTNLPKEIESRVIFTIVTKPSTRLEIVVGKVMGFSGVSAAMLLIMGVFTVGYLQLRAWTLQKNIRSLLQAGMVESTSEQTLRHYADAGLLNTTALAWPQALQIYSRLPSDDGPRWLTGEQMQYFTVPFTLTEAQKATFNDIAQQKQTVFPLLINTIWLDQSAMQLAAPPPEPESLFMGPLFPGSDSAAPARVGPMTAPTSRPVVLPPPGIQLHITSENNSAIGGAELAQKIFTAPPRTPGAAEDVRSYATLLSPLALADMASAGEFQVDVSGTSGGVEYGADPNSTAIEIAQPIAFHQLGSAPEVATAPEAGQYRLYNSNKNELPVPPITVPKGAPLGFAPAGQGAITAVVLDRGFILPDANYLWLRTSQRITPVRKDQPDALAAPHFYSHGGRAGMQIRGANPGEAQSPMGVFQFEHADVEGGRNGNVTLQLHIFIERAGDVDAERNALSQASVQIRNRKTGELSQPPVVFEPESSRFLYVEVPAKWFVGGDFDVVVRGLTPGQFLGLAGPAARHPSVAVVTANTFFVVNLFKSLTMLWLLSVLVVVISLFCSTFLSWPIAVVLTLMLLLGHWGVEQLSDAMGPGWSRTPAVELFGLRGAASNKAFTSTMEAMSKTLRVVASVLPDVAKFPVIEDIGAGVSIPIPKVRDAAAELAMYGLPLIILTYLVLRNKEVAP